jgi:general secretion pathway protein A
LLAAVFFFIFYHFKLSDQSALSTPGRVENSRPEQMKTFVVPAQESKEKTAAGPTAPDSAPKPSEDLAGFLRRLAERSSRQAALKASLTLWGTEAVIREHLDNIENDEDFFRIAAIQNGFSILPIQNDPELVQKLDTPAIIEWYLPGDAAPRYGVIKAIDGNRLTFEAGDEKASVEASMSELKSYWTGSAYIPWKNFLGLPAARPFSLSEDAVIALKTVLQDIGFNDIQINASYDRETREAIRQIQERHGLITDGIVGPLTQIALYGEIKSAEIARINKR